MNKFQIFADATATMAADIQPVISFDYATQLATDLSALREVLGIQTMRAMTEGSQIKLYKTTVDQVGDQPAEGDVIPLTHVSRKLVRTIDLVLKKFRKETTADAIQSAGLANALNETDKKLTDLVRQGVLSAFYGNLINAKSATAAKGGANLQAALSSAWGEVRKFFKDVTATPIYFVSVDDVADYLGSANPVLATSGGMTYIENFLGLGTVVITPELPGGTLYATAKENLYGAYVPANGSVGDALGLTADETGTVGMKHYVGNDTANVGTLLLSGVQFFAELEDGVISAPVGAKKTAPAASK